MFWGEPQEEQALLPGIWHRRVNCKEFEEELGFCVGEDGSGQGYGWTSIERVVEPVPA